MDNRDNFDNECCDNRDNLKKSFWKLIEEKTILIPNYQREYAQGRKNRRAELIRNGFVNSLYDAINNNSPLELDFIFGGRKSDTENSKEFEPVDGQQRLTILFLLHWYVFMRADKKEDLEKLGKRFLYRTRNSSETFCQELCDEKWSFKLDEQLKDQIRKRHWFTGAMESDPTVDSMLNVIDTIHEKFGENLDYEGVASTLKGDNCPIMFYCLELKKALRSDADVRDLYIKMNARGISLTDFEVFKADLQKKDTENGRFDLLSKYLGTDDTPARRAELIGKFNYEYTNLFFKLIDKGKIVNVEENLGNDEKPVTSMCQLFDVSMMNFINELFRMDYFCLVSESGVSQKDYRRDNDYFRKMSGREFSDFLRSCGSFLNEKYFGTEKDDKLIIEIAERDISEAKARKNSIPRDAQDRRRSITKENAIISKNTKIKAEAEKNIQELQRISGNAEDVFKCTFDKLIRLFELMVSELDEKKLKFKFEGSGSEKCCFSFSDMIKKYASDPQGNSAPSAKDSLARMGLFEFVLEFGVPNTDEKKKAFETWNRYVWKIDRNSDFKNLDEVIETLRGYRKIIKLCQGSCSESAVLKAIVEFKAKLDNGSIDRGNIGAPAELQLEEEAIKAQLVLDNVEWQELLLEAENYFSSRGQVWFLLELSKLDDNPNKDRFSKAFEISKKIFNSSYCADENLSTLFERALLAEKGENGEFVETDHLMSMGSGTIQTKKFVTPDYAEHLSHRYSSGPDPRENVRYKITESLLKEMIDDSEINDVKTWLETYIQNGSSEVDWKDVFIKYDIINKTVRGLTFKNGFEPDAWEDDGYRYTAVYTTEKRREGSGELHSFLLAYKLETTEVRVKYVTSESKYIVGGFPSRYFTVNGKDVGYIKGSYWYRTDGQIAELGNLEKAFEKICAWEES